jgi:phosphatidylserine decarboxylase
MLTGYGKREWGAILLITIVLVGVAIWFKAWISLGLVIFVSLALLSFFRDPPRTTPTTKNVMTSPADGRVSSIHDVESFPGFSGQPAVCVRIFLSVADVHVNRAPCKGVVSSLTHRDGIYLNVLKPESAELNEALTMVLSDPTSQTPVAAIRQIAGLIARTIVNPCKLGDNLDRGQRYGMIKFGSTTELYLPKSSNPTILVAQGQYVWGGHTVLANINPADPSVKPA